ncbi:hypothetical protein BGW37DRAFT_555463 [Umbelopsis sp. PMI_123]|nr:hypothetical protein BGW37DRAFT_555463 [Umbelopsis sp. PMI_123]
MFQKAISIQLVEPVIYIRGGNANVIQYNNIIRGFVVVHSSRLTVIQDIRLQLIGVAKTLWPEGIGADGSQTHDKKRFLHQSINIDLGNGDDSDRLYNVYSGYNRFPFEMFVPSDVPESIECELGYVEYRLIASMRRPRRFPLSSEFVAQVPVQLIRLPVDVSGSGDSPAESISISRGLPEFGDYSITVEKHIVSPGTTLPVSLRFLSLVPKARIESVTVKIHERCTIRAPDKGVTRIINHKVTLRRTDQVSPNLGINMDDLCGLPWEDRLFYEIPDDRKMPLHPSTSYRDINIRHWIQVLVKVSVPNPNEEEVGPLLVKEVMLDSKIWILRAGATTVDFVTLPQYSERIQGDDMCLAWGDLPDYSQTMMSNQPPPNNIHTFLDFAKPTHIGKRINSIISRCKSHEHLSESAKEMAETPKGARFRFSCVLPNFSHPPEPLQSTSTGNPRHSDSILCRLQSAELF